MSLEDRATTPGRGHVEGLGPALKGEGACGERSKNKGLSSQLWKLRRAQKRWERTGVRSGEARINLVVQIPKLRSGEGRWSNLLKMSEDLGTGVQVLRAGAQGVYVPGSLMNAKTETAWGTTELTGEEKPNDREKLGGAMELG